MARTGALYTVALCIFGLSLTFVTQLPSSSPNKQAPASNGVSPQTAQLSGFDWQTASEAASTAWDTSLRLVAGMALGALVMVSSAGPVHADIEDVSISVDGKGKTTQLTKEGLVRGKRLFVAACASCHVGGGTRTNQNVGLGIEELSGSQPPRNNVDSIVDYLNSPTTYDGLKDISDIHPSIRQADLWPKMRSMKQQDLADISAYILYMTQTIPEKWGGGKQYY
eukprot:TRINITY_DN8805_c0_g1_i2.p1 TRINITY_DN8805_c0_g1~~TRINITY_DN8805_c0_g1_i2.p1  ORF type:complete len:224 (+),score=44.64 TRINITY_DN8805_c0_g1_i2:93-764(+)